MSKFFTCENRLILQKKLKQSISIEEVVANIEKNPTTASGENNKYFLEIATGYPDYLFNECKNRFNCHNKNICNKDCTRKSDV